MAPSTQSNRFEVPLTITGCTDCLNKAGPYDTLSLYTGCRTIGESAKSGSLSVSLFLEDDIKVRRRSYKPPSLDKTSYLYLPAQFHTDCEGEGRYFKEGMLLVKSAAELFLWKGVSAMLEPSILENEWQATFNKSTRTTRADTDLITTPRTVVVNELKSDGFLTGASYGGIGHDFEVGQEEAEMTSASGPSSQGTHQNSISTDTPKV